MTQSTGMWMSIQQMNDASRSFRAGQQNIRHALDVLNAQMSQLNDAVYQTDRATQFRLRYRSIAADLENVGTIVGEFALDLDNARNRLVEAAAVSNRLPFGAVWSHNLDPSLGVMLQDGPVGHLLPDGDTLYRLPPALRKYFQGGRWKDHVTEFAEPLAKGVFELTEDVPELGLMAGLVAFGMTGDPLELSKGAMKTLVTLEFGTGGTADFVAELGSGFIDYAETGDPADLIAGGLKGFVSVAAHDVMAVNAGVQLAANGTAYLVAGGADWLAAGDPILTESFRAQAGRLSAAADRADLNQAISDISRSIVSGRPVGAILGEVAVEVGDTALGWVQLADEFGDTVTSARMGVERQFSNAVMDFFGVEEAYQAQYNASIDQQIRMLHQDDLAVVGDVLSRGTQALGDFLGF